MDSGAGHPRRRQGHLRLARSLANCRKARPKTQRRPVRGVVCGLELGGIGGTTSLIINAPMAILGVSRASMKPVYRDGALVPRTMLPLSLSYDHRVIDGADGARFGAALVAALADVAGLLEAVP
jgi:pyruvate dehydrogenase E2 component (dihydrolipoamide acetyltransferase)